jgi:hypothetical protein
MVFRGIYPAPELVPSPVGLFSVARVMTHTAREYDERWVRGFAYEFDSQATIRLLTVNDETISDGELSDPDNIADNEYRDYYPFFIESEVAKSTFGLPGEDRFKLALKQLEAASQKAIEFELWDGFAARAANAAAGNGNSYLTEAAAVTEVSNGAHNASEALYLLEGAIAGSPTGDRGVIHMTRDVASLLGSRLVYLKDDEKGITRVMTRIGTPVVVGSGYSGRGPVGDAAAAASLTNKWMFATGPVDVHLGKPEVVNDSLAQGQNVSINDMLIKAVRPAAVYFDPSIHFCAQVTLPSVA